MTMELTFTTGFALTDTAVFASGAADSLEVFAKFTRIVEYSEFHPPHWWYHDMEWRACAIGYFGPKWENFDDTVVLSEEGHVRYIGDHNPLQEKILGAGVFSEDAKGWGYLSDIQQIGEHLYACGYSGQVYKRLGRANWLPPKAFFFNGRAWRELELPEVAERITNLYVESESRIWMCGANGTLLLGNAQNGFKSLSSVDDNQLFLSVCKFQDKMYLGSNLGLFVYDPTDHKAGIREVKTNLQPELQDANIVNSYEKVLWSTGPKNIARFDGKTWERIHHPGNPRIGV